MTKSMRLDAYKSKKLGKPIYVAGNGPMQGK
jgi:hypothetical protein